MIVDKKGEVVDITNKNYDGSELFFKMPLKAVIKSVSNSDISNVQKFLQFISKSDGTSSSIYEKILGLFRRDIKYKEYTIDSKEHIPTTIKRIIDYNNIILNENKITKSIQYSGLNGTDRVKNINMGPNKNNLALLSSTIDILPIMPLMIIFTVIRLNIEKGMETNRTLYDSLDSEWKSLLPSMESSVPEDNIKEMMNLTSSISEKIVEIINVTVKISSSIRNKMSEDDKNSSTTIRQVMNKFREYDLVSRKDLLGDLKLDIIYNDNKEDNKVVFRNIFIKRIYDKMRSLLNRDHNYSSYTNITESIEEMLDQIKEMLHDNKNTAIFSNQEIENIEEVIRKKGLIDKLRFDMSKYPEFKLRTYLMVVINLLSENTKDCVILDDFDYPPDINTYELKTKYIKRALERMPSTDLELGEDDMLVKPKKTDRDTVNNDKLKPNIKDDNKENDNNQLGSIMEDVDNDFLQKNSVYKINDEVRISSEKQRAENELEGINNTFLGIDLNNIPDKHYKKSYDEFVILYNSTKTKITNATDNFDDIIRDSGIHEKLEEFKDKIRLISDKIVLDKKLKDILQRFNDMKFTEGKRNTDYYKKINREFITLYNSTHDTLKISTSNIHEMLDKSGLYEMIENMEQINTNYYKDIFYKNDLVKNINIMDKIKGKKTTEIIDIIRNVYITEYSNYVKERIGDDVIIYKYEEDVKSSKHIEDIGKITEKYITIVDNIDTESIKLDSDYVNNKIKSIDESIGSIEIPYFIEDSIEELKNNIVYERNSIKDKMNNIINNDNLGKEQKNLMIDQLITGTKIFDMIRNIKEEIFESYKSYYKDILYNSIIKEDQSIIDGIITENYNLYDYNDDSDIISYIKNRYKDEVSLILKKYNLSEDEISELMESYSNEIDTKPIEKLNDITNKYSEIVRGRINNKNKDYIRNLVDIHNIYYYYDVVGDDTNISMNEIYSKLKAYQSNNFRIFDDSEENDKIILENHKQHIHRIYELSKTIDIELYECITNTRNIYNCIKNYSEYIGFEIDNNIISVELILEKIDEYIDKEYNTVVGIIKTDIAYMLKEIYEKTGINTIEYLSTIDNKDQNRVYILKNSSIVSHNMKITGLQYVIDRQNAYYGNVIETIKHHDTSDYKELYTIIETNHNNYNQYFTDMSNINNILKEIEDNVIIPGIRSHYESYFNKTKDMEKSLIQTLLDYINYQNSLYNNNLLKTNNNNDIQNLISIIYNNNQTIMSIDMTKNQDVIYEPMSQVDDDDEEMILTPEDYVMEVDNPQVIKDAIVPTLENIMKSMNNDDESEIIYNYMNQIIDRDNTKDIEEDIIELVQNITGEQFSTDDIGSAMMMLQSRYIEDEKSFK